MHQSSTFSYSVRGTTVASKTERSAISSCTGTYCCVMYEVCYMHLNIECYGNVTSVFKHTCTMSRTTIRSSITCMCR